MPDPILSPTLFEFLDDLAANNDRDWFTANKDRYIEHVQEPALELIRGFAPRLEALSPHFTADAKVVGGSLFRIQRDTRFSADKTPYKLNTGIHFRHERSKDAHTPGYYLHLQPGECFAGVGLWRPATADAYRIREAIDADPDGWRAAVGEGFAEVWTLTGDSLKRPPRGYPADHPLIDDLKRKDFIATAPLTEDEITSPGFVEELAARYSAAGRFMAFLCGALDLEF